jgi:hypothetical protein
MVVTQGWRNPETQSVVLWLDNDAALYHAAMKLWRTHGNKAAFLEALRALITDHITESLRPSLALDLLQTGLSRVDWQAILTLYTDDLLSRENAA